VSALDPVHVILSVSDPTRSDSREPSMNPPEVEATAAFIRAINARDLTAMAALMTDDHTFIDSGGTTVTGRDEILRGWPGYWAMFPDYRIAVNDVLQDGSLVAIFGSWAATYAGKRRAVPANAVGSPAAWKAIVEDGRIKTWQVYADHTRTVEVMRADEAPSDA
jgi:ketosteroid isomerase-like protein